MKTLTQQEADRIAELLRHSDCGAFSIYDYLVKGSTTCAAWAADSVDTVLNALSDVVGEIDSTDFGLGSIGSRVVVYFPSLRVAA